MLNTPTLAHIITSREIPEPSSKTARHDAATSSLFAAQGRCYPQGLFTSHVVSSIPVSHPVLQNTNITSEMDVVAEDSLPIALPAPAPATDNGHADATTPKHARPATPISSAIKPPESEMHPQRHRISMAEPSSALRLGFSDIKPKTSGLGVQLDTPSRSNRVPQSAFTFRFGQETSVASLNLSENAQRLLADLRDSVTRCKADLVAKREAEEEAGDRKIAQAKGKSGRFSAAHMAEFKKMDSIEGHASAWRANRNTPVKPEFEASASKPVAAASTTPVKAGLKRTRSKANLDATPVSQGKPLAKTTPSQAIHSVNGGSSHKKRTATDALYSKPVQSTNIPEPSSSFAKRIKKYQNQDASAARPVSRDESSIPRPKSSQSSIVGFNASRLTSPTKASLAHQGKPTISLVQPDAQPEPPSSPSKAASLGRRILSPKGLQKVKSILRGDRTNAEGARTAIPKPALSGSLTPGRQPADKALPPLPATTPRRKLAKQVSFTPDTKRAAAAQDTPSPKKTMAFKGHSAGSNVHYPSMDGILTESQTEETSGEVVYPDLSGFHGISGLGSEKKKDESSVPGTFTFRSDHTIDFEGTSTSGFGASPGQASLRQVRASLAPKGKMPGGFPEAPPTSIHSNKENKAPAPSQKMAAAPHGMSNKKRHRVTWDEENAEMEEADRAAKRRKNEHVPEGHALVAPRMAAQTPGSSKRLQAVRGASRTPGSPASASPTKKKAGISLSRLNALARPKLRG